MRLFIFATACFLLASGARGQQWPTTKWRVACFNQDRDAHIAVDEGFASSCLKETDLDAGQCDDTNPTSATSSVRYELDQASTWLEALDFRAPTARRSEVDSMRYGAWVTAGTLRLPDGDECHVVKGAYHRTAHTLLLNADHVMIASGEDDFSRTPAHELFHAVMQSYPLSETFGSGSGWIVEGMSDAIRHMARRREIGGPLYLPDFGRRPYDVPLHRVTGHDVYATAHFWLGVGDIIGSPETIGYLHHVLEDIDDAEDAMSSLHSTLDRLHPGGLYDIFPKFIARDAIAYQHYPTRQRLPASTREKAKVTDTVEPLAADFVAILIPDVPPATRAVVTLDDRPELHLVIDHELYSQDATFRENHVRNQATLTVAPQDTLFVRVVNVAPEAGKSRQAPYTLTVELTEPQTCASGAPYGASVTVSGTGPAIGGGYALRVPFAAETEEVMGRTAEYFHGLTAVKTPYTGTMVVWSRAGELRSRQTVERTRDMVRDMGWEEKSPAQIMRLAFGLDPEVRERYLGEPEAQLTNIGDALGQAVSLAVPQAGAPGAFAFGFVDAERGAGVQLGVAVQNGIQPGRYGQAEGARAVVQSSAFGADGIQLFEPVVTILDVDEAGCAMGTFEGSYAIEAGKPFTVRGAFSLTLPPGVPAGSL